MVVHAKPTYYANRGTLSPVRPRDPDGRARRAAGPARAAPPAAGRRGAVRRRAASAGCRSCPARVGLVTAPDSAAERDVLENARRRWPAVRFEVRVRRRCRAPARPREVIEALGRLDRDPEVDVIVVARGGGSVEDLLPFSDEALLRAVLRGAHPGRLRDRPRAGQPAARPGRRRARLDPHRRRQAGGARRGRGGRAGRRSCATAAAGCSTAWLAREQHALDAVRARPALADPGSGLSRRAAGEVDELRDRARRTVAPPARPGRRRPRPPAGPGAGAVAAGHPAARLRRAAGRRRATWSPASAQVAPGDALQRPGRRRPDRASPGHRTPARRRARPHDVDEESER